MNHGRRAGVQEVKSGGQLQQQIPLSLQRQISWNAAKRVQQVMQRALLAELSDHRRTILHARQQPQHVWMAQLVQEAEVVLKRFKCCF